MAGMGLGAAWQMLSFHAEKADLDGVAAVVDRGTMSRLVYLDQNAWVTLAKGAWDKKHFPQEHAALSKVVGMVRTGSITVPLSSTNIYETSKVNELNRRTNLARVQSLVSGGIVFRGRRRILAETLAVYITEKLAISRLPLRTWWFLSDLWFEAAGDYSEETNGLIMSERYLESIRQYPGRDLFDFMVSGNDDVRLEAVRRFSNSSADLIARIESRRALVAGETLPLKKRAYSATLVIDELDFILKTGRGLGLEWSTVADIGSSLVRSIVAGVPVLNVERELAVRLEDQCRNVSENDLRDMAAFTTVLPLSDVVVAEKQFVNLARQARLDERYATTLLTSIYDL